MEEIFRKLIIAKDKLLRALWPWDPYQTVFCHSKGGVNQNMT